MQSVSVTCDREHGVSYHHGAGLAAADASCSFVQRGHACAVCYSRLLGTGSCTVHMARVLNALHSRGRHRLHVDRCRMRSAQGYPRGAMPRDLLQPSLPLAGLGVAVALCTWGCVYYCKKRRAGGAKVAPKV